MKTTINEITNKKEDDMLMSILNELKNLDVELDDGGDEGDREQNRRFSDSIGKLKSINQRLALIDFYDVESDEVDEIWLGAWGGMSATSPEGLYNHSVRFIEAMQKRLNKISE